MMNVYGPVAVVVTLDVRMTSQSKFTISISALSYTFFTVHSSSPHRTSALQAPALSPLYILTRPEQHCQRTCSVKSFVGAFRLVAIIGGGTSGLTAAYFLTLMGHQIHSRTMGYMVKTLKNATPALSEFVRTTEHVVKEIVAAESNLLLPV